MIELKDISKWYGGHGAVKKLNLKIDEGEIVGIIGQNGAGKSTTLKMIAGLLRPTEGTVHVLGHDMSVGRSANLAKRKIGYLPEESSLYGNMSVSQYLHFFAGIYEVPKALAETRIQSLLESLNLVDEGKLTAELSKGMRRKVSIARVLLHDPSLLILDEPNSGLDPLTSFFIINYLRKLASNGKTILLSAHNLFHIEYICDRVAIIKDGQLLMFDSMEKIRADLGQRQFEVVFQADQSLPYDSDQGNYRFLTEDVHEIARILGEIVENDWVLINLSVSESALEEIYVKLFADV